MHRKTLFNDKGATAQTLTQSERCEVIYLYGQTENSEYVVPFNKSTWNEFPTFIMISFYQWTWSW